MNPFSKIELIKVASELTEEVRRITGKFPEAERYISVQIIRDSAMTVLEYAAFGSAPYTPALKCTLFLRAISSLKLLESRLIVSKNDKYISSSDYHKLEEKTGDVKNLLDTAVQFVKFSKHDSV